MENPSPQFILLVHCRWTADRDRELRHNISDVLSRGGMYTRRMHIVVTRRDITTNTTLVVSAAIGRLARIRTVSLQTKSAQIFKEKWTLTRLRLLSPLPIFVFVCEYW